MLQLSVEIYIAIGKISFLDFTWHFINYSDILIFKNPEYLLKLFSIMLL